MPLGIFLLLFTPVRKQKIQQGKEIRESEMMDAI